MGIAALVLLLVLAVVLLVFATVGALRTFRATPVERVQVEGPAPPPGPASAEFAELVDLWTGATLHPGNCVEVLRDGDGTFPRLWADLEAAERRVDFQVYFAESGRVAETTFGILARKAEEGVRVRFLYDPVGTRGLDGGYIEALRRAGADARATRPLRPGRLDRFNHRVHSRVVVVDGMVGYTGGLGISDRWLGDGRTRGSWRETSARFRGPAVRQLAAAFGTLWAELTGELRVEPVAAEFLTGGEGARAALLHTSPSVGSTAAERLLALTLGCARERLYLSSGYFAPGEELAALLGAAAARGVDVRVLTAAPEHTDIPWAYWAGRGVYPRLLAEGVRIYEYQPSMMHAKTFAVDGAWSAIGAMNFDNRSVALNDETVLLVQDARVGAQMTEIFLDDLTRAREITRADAERWSWTERARAWGAHRVARLL